ncbi:TPA: hypothetical protein ACMFQN_005197 [Pseudomonas aeruginosa]
MTFAPHQCPECGGTDHTGGSYDCDGDVITQEILCHACGAAWTDNYTYAGRTVIEHGSQYKPEEKKA